MRREDTRFSLFATGGLIGQHRANRFQVFFGVVLGSDIMFFDGTADHDQSAAGTEAHGQHCNGRDSHQYSEVTMFRPSLLVYLSSGLFASG